MHVSRLVRLSYAMTSAGELTLHAPIRKVQYSDAVQSHARRREGRRGGGKGLWRGHCYLWRQLLGGFSTVTGELHWGESELKKNVSLTSPPSPQRRITYYRDNFTSHACSPAAVISQGATRGILGGGLECYRYFSLTPVDGRDLLLKGNSDLY